MKAKAQTILSQLKILYPSRIPMGIRLNNAINPFQRASKRSKPEYGFGTNAAPRSTDEKAMLIIGPARDIFAISSILAGPEIMTAPGAIILNKGEITEIKVKAAPHSVKRNSAHKPLLCAVTLCAISCVKKDAVKITAKKLIPDQPVRTKISEKSPIDKPMPITSNVAAAKCLSSFGLK